MIDLVAGNGKVIVITGGNRGIGFEAVKKLLSLRYKIIIGCRNPAKCHKDLEKLKQEKIIDQSSDFECLALDLNKLESVRKFAEVILDKKCPVHVLINNGKC